VAGDPNQKFHLLPLRLDLPGGAALRHRTGTALDEVRPDCFTWNHSFFREKVPSEQWPLGRNPYSPREAIGSLCHFDKNLISIGVIEAGPSRGL
jgi:hypothetical protein